MFTIQRSIDVDNEIIKETNSELNKINNDVKDLYEMINTLNELTINDQEKLDNVEINLNITENNITDTLPILEEVIELKESGDNKYTMARVLTGSLIGSLICTPIGALFGLVPSIIGLTIGFGTGAASGYFIDKDNITNILK